MSLFISGLRLLVALAAIAAFAGFARAGEANSQPPPQCSAIIAKASKGTLLDKTEQSTIATCYFGAEKPAGIAPAYETMTVAPSFFSQDSRWSKAPPQYIGNVGKAVE